MTEQRIAEAQARLDAISPTPWASDDLGLYSVGRAMREEPLSYDLSLEVARDDHWSMRIREGTDLEFIIRAPDDLRDALAALRRVRDVLKNKSRIVVSHSEGVEVVNVSDVLAALDGEG